MLQLKLRVALFLGLRSTYSVKYFRDDFNSPKKRDHAQLQTRLFTSHVNSDTLQRPTTMNSFKTLRAPAGRFLFTRALAGTTVVRARASGQATVHQTLSTRVAFASAGAGVAFTTHSHTRDAKHGGGGPATNFFDLKAKGKRHQEVSMSDFENKVILVVNVASKCGFTDQYAELESIYKKYKDKGFTVIGFPCNQFGGQV